MNSAQPLLLAIPTALLMSSTALTHAHRFILCFQKLNETTYQARQARSDPCNEFRDAPCMRHSMQAALRSCLLHTHFWQASARLAAIMTCAPAHAKPLAAWNPIPLLPPVTIATLPVWSGTSKPPIFTIVLYTMTYGMHSQIPCVVGEAHCRDFAVVLQCPTPNSTSG